ncbi:MAG: hypothetical protein M1830_001919 [Pleopsidium flavum]|nr:MAG: hypothetical protein M1830_001919 [Pleopsidium flavum]
MSLVLGRSFETLEEAKQVIIRWVVDRGESFKVFKSDSKRCWVVICRDKSAECPFRMRVNRTKKGAAVLTVMEPHTCSASTHIGFRQANSIALLSSNEDVVAAVANDRNIRPKEIQRKAELRHGNKVSYQQSWRTRKLLRTALFTTANMDSTRRRNLTEGSTDSEGRVNTGRPEDSEDKGGRHDVENEKRVVCHFKISGITRKEKGKETVT